ncbi:hypothetical protein J28TS4_31300 [Paenibacillus lautus]|nr:hypothetical protein J28TS4_31300 [Paenibacillus lautus]
MHPLSDRFVRQACILEQVLQYAKIDFVEFMSAWHANVPFTMKVSSPNSFHEAVGRNYSDLYNGFKNHIN